MTGWEIVATVALLLAVVAIGMLSVAVAGARRQAAVLARRLEALETRLPAAEPPVTPIAKAVEDTAPYVITRLGQAPTEVVAPAPGTATRVTLSGAAFADAVVRETVVQAASLAHGVRRALRPEVRHRIRFEMKRELKRSRKARKAEMRAALREFRARRRQADPSGSTA